MKVTAGMIPALLDDLGAANAELQALALQAPAFWARGPRGGWTVGQHVGHVGRMLAIGAEGLEAAAAAARAGTLAPRPWRGPLQGWFVALATGRRFPRGGRSIAAAVPASTPDRDPAFAALDEGLRRHRRLAAGLSGAELQALWMRNPFTRLRWHYTLPEVLRVQANHTRHHARLVAEFLVAVGVARTAA